jgi:hypothetical protein
MYHKGYDVTSNTKHNESKAGQLGKSAVGAQYALRNSETTQAAIRVVCLVYGGTTDE